MTILKDLFSLFYPPLCCSCEGVLNKDEKYICLPCKLVLPRTHFHKQRDNHVEKIFWGRFPFAAATAFLVFQKGGNVQQLMHNIKYKGAKEAAFTAGTWFGSDLTEEAAFASIDAIIPVPLHKSKLRSRGFNQSEWLGKGMAQPMNKDLSIDNLIRTKKTDTQTKKSRSERWENVNDIFQVNDPPALAGKHLLLVDDVVTTGSTLESCAQALLKIEPAPTISIATLAVAVH